MIHIFNGPTSERLVKHFKLRDYLAETKPQTSAVKVGIFDHEHTTIKPVNRK